MGGGGGEAAAGRDKQARAGRRVPVRPAVAGPGSLPHGTGRGKSECGLWPAALSGPVEAPDTGTGATPGGRLPVTEIHWRIVWQMP